MNAAVAREMQILREANAELAERTEILSMSSKPYFDVTDDRPVLTVTVDNWCGVLDLPEAIYLAEEIVHRGRQVAMKLRLIVREALVRECGGSNSLRYGAEVVTAEDDVDVFLQSLTD